MVVSLFKADLQHNIVHRVSFSVNQTGLQKH